MKNVSKILIDIAEYLSRLKRGGGLIDPEENKIVMNSYGTEFYAMLCAFIYSKNKENIWLKRAVESLKASLGFIKKRSEIKGMFRWDFKRYALTKTYSLLKNELNSELKEELEIFIKSEHELYSFKTNRLALQSLNLALRYQEFKDERDINKAKKLIEKVLKRQTKQGFFPDEINSYSSQYHSFILALLYEYFLITKDDNVEHFFMKGIDFSISLMDKNGFFDFGRGKKQIFGYASLIYALYGASNIMMDSYYAKIAEIVESNVVKKIKDGKDYKIVFDNEKLYYYNHVSDYLPFFAYYLLASDRNYISFKSTKKIDLNNLQKRPNHEITIVKFLNYHFMKYLYYIGNYSFNLKEIYLMLKIGKKE